MIDGFNEGWIAFEFGPAKSRKGSVRLESVFEITRGEGLGRKRASKFSSMPTSVFTTAD
jgi:hypothetical protein